MRMTRSKDSFVLMGTGDHTMEIVSAKLWMRKLKIAPSLGLAHEKMLTRKTAKYPLSRVEVKVFHLPAGQKSFTHDALFLGQLPKRVVLGIVDNRAFNGDLTLNPLNPQFPVTPSRRPADSMGPSEAFFRSQQLCQEFLHTVQLGGWH